MPTGDREAGIGISAGAAACELLAACQLLGVTTRDADKIIHVSQPSEQVYNNM